MVLQFPGKWVTGVSFECGEVHCAFVLLFEVGMIFSSPCDKKMEYYFVSPREMYLLALDLGVLSGLSRWICLGLKK